MTAPTGQLKYCRCTSVRISLTTHDISHRLPCRTNFLLTCLSLSGLQVRVLINVFQLYEEGGLEGDEGEDSVSSYRCVSQPLPNCFLLNAWACHPVLRTKYGVGERKNTVVPRVLCCRRIITFIKSVLEPFSQKCSYQAGNSTHCGIRSSKTLWNTLFRAWQLPGRELHTL